MPNEVTMSTQKFFGGIGVFTPGDDINTYLKRMDNLFELNNIKDESKLTYFVTFIGGEVYKILKSLLEPKPVKGTSYADLKKALKTHFQPNINVIAERFMFNQRNQHQN